MKRFILSILCCLWLNQARAVGLVDVYRDAVQNDPTFKQAQGDFMTNKEVLPQARAALLPSLDLVASASKSWNGGTTSKAMGYGYKLTASQTLFNWSALSAWRAAKSSANQAAAMLIAAQQDLILRTATAYFNVLQAQETLSYAKANQTALASTLAVTKQRYHLGLEPISLVYQAQAEYDADHANYLTAQMKLSEQQEGLRIISNKIYPSLNQLAYNFLLVPPDPCDQDAWTNVAVTKNLSLKAARFAMLTAQNALHAKQDLQLPTLTLNGSYGADNNNNNNKPDEQLPTAAVSLNANFNIYNGGATSSAARQAQGQYQTASAMLDLEYRTVVEKARQTYLKVTVGVSQVEADQQAVKSSIIACKSIIAGYKVGTQTIDSILTQQSKLSQAQMIYVKDRYAYLLATLELKQVAGSLSITDLATIDQWLSANQQTILTASDQSMAIVPQSAKTLVKA